MAFWETPCISGNSKNWQTGLQLSKPVQQRKDSMVKAQLQSGDESLPATHWMGISLYVHTPDRRDLSLHTRLGRSLYLYTLDRRYLCPHTGWGRPPYIYMLDGGDIYFWKIHKTKSNQQLGKWICQFLKEIQMAKMYLKHLLSLVSWSCITVLGCCFIWCLKVTFTPACLSLPPGISSAWPYPSVVVCPVLSLLLNILVGVSQAVPCWLSLPCCWAHISFLTPLLSSFICVSFPFEAVIFRSWLLNSFPST